MKRKTYSTFSKITAMLLLVLLSVLLLVDAAALLILSETGAFFDNGISLRRLIYEEVASDACSTVFNSYLTPRLRGEERSSETIDERYSSENCNLFFSVTDEGGNLLYQNYDEADSRYKASIRQRIYDIPESVYNGGMYWLEQAMTIESTPLIGADSSVSLKLIDAQNGTVRFKITSAPASTEESTVDYSNNTPTLYLAANESTEIDSDDRLKSNESERTVTLTFTAHVREKLTAHDRLYYLIGLADFIIAHRVFLAVSCGVGVILAVLLFVFLMCSAGHHRAADGSDELAPEILDSVPLDLYAGIVGTVCIWLAYIALRTIDTNSFSVILRCTAVMVCIVFAELLLLSLILTTATRVKCKTWWKTTLVYSVLSLVFRMLRWFFRKLGYILSNISTLWKACCAFLGLSLFEFVVLVSTARETVLLWWFIEKLVFGLIGFFVLTDWKKLYRGAKSIAAGDPNSRIDPHGMYGEFKRHAAHLNSIGDGVQRAVNDRLKSERFKTELITNVSHDLKTPLTSIVNYVDLMKKEDIRPEKAKEYLEVLDRQSKRLQKLTVDLVEASKASTGNLPVNAEKTDIRVFLSQLAGEYEEKLAAADLEAVITYPEEDVFIYADGRLLWRVFDNLMNNIGKYAQENTRVYISAVATDTTVTVTFKNISRYPLNISSDELMERFVRGDTSRNTEGSGLGLSIARSLVDLQKGKFELVVDGDLFKVILTFDRYYEPETETEYGSEESI